MKSNSSFIELGIPTIESTSYKNTILDHIEHCKYLSPQNYVNDNLSSFIIHIYIYIYIYIYIFRISNVEIRYNYHCQGHVRLYILYLESQHIESICVCLQCTLLQSHFLFKRNMFQKMFAFLYCDVCNPPSLFLFFLCLSSKRCKRKSAKLDAMLEEALM